MVKKKETEFEKLARLIKEEGEDIRGEIKDEIKNEVKGLERRVDGFERRMDERFTRLERRLDTAVQPQLDGHARRIKILEVKTARI